MSSANGEGGAALPGEVESSQLPRPCSPPPGRCHSVRIRVCPVPSVCLRRVLRRGVYVCDVPRKTRLMIHPPTSTPAARCRYLPGHAELCDLHPRLRVLRWGLMRICMHHPLKTRMNTAKCSQHCGDDDATAPSRCSASAGPIDRATAHLVSVGPPSVCRPPSVCQPQSPPLNGHSFAADARSDIGGHARTHARACPRACTHARTHARTHLHTHAHTHAHARMHARTYLHTHAHTHERARTVGTRSS